jgi:hypothetical protein
METAKSNTKPDLRRTLTCAALATVTTLGMFSLVANVMTPLFAGIRLLSTGTTAQETRRSFTSDEDICVPTAHREDARDLTKPAVI